MHIHAKKAETSERTQTTTGRGINEELLKRREESGNEVKMKGDTKLSLTIC